MPEDDDVPLKFLLDPRLREFAELDNEHYDWRDY